MIKAILQRPCWKSGFVMLLSWRLEKKKKICCPYISPHTQGAPGVKWCYFIVVSFHVLCVCINVCAEMRVRAYLYLFTFCKCVLTPTPARTHMYTYTQRGRASRQAAHGNKPCCLFSQFIYIPWPRRGRGLTLPPALQQGPLLAQTLGVCQRLPCARQHSAAGCPRLRMKKEK